MIVRSDSKVPSMVGKKYGRLTVRAIVGRRHYGKPRRDGSRASQIIVRVECDCGSEYDCAAAQVRHRGVSRCRACAAEDAGYRARHDTSLRLPNGKTIAEIAALSGVALDTVYHRFLRGWPIEKLGIPLRPRAVAKGKKGVGAATYLEQRRRLVYPHHAGRAA